MDNQEVKILIGKLRQRAKVCGENKLVAAMKELLLDAADELEIQMKEKERLERWYINDMTAGSYVCLDGLMRQFVKMQQNSPDGRADLNSLNAWLRGLDQIPGFEARATLLKNAGREFRIWTPLGDLKVHAKTPLDDPEDFPGVYIEALRPDGTELLCCVDYDSVAKGMYCRVYAEGDEPSDSIRFEDLED